MLKLSRLVPLLLILSPVLAYAQGAPQNLASSVNGSTVTLTWNGGSGSYVVEAALTPGGAVIATLPITGTTLVVPNVPTGTYYVRVRDASGGAASNEVTVSVSGGCPGPPLPPTLIVQSVGSQATVTWRSSGGCAPTNFTLLAGSAPGLSNVAVVAAGPQLGLSAIAPPGVYYVRVVGTNAFGTAVSQELTVRVAANAQTDTVVPFGAVAFDLVMTQSGNYVASLLWDDPTIDLDLYLTSPGCAYPPVNCLLSVSDTTGTNTEQVSRSVSVGQSYRLWIDNFSNRTTSFTVFNTIGGAPALSAPVMQNEDGSGETPQLKKVKP